MWVKTNHKKRSTYLSDKKTTYCFIPANLWTGKQWLFTNFTSMWSVVLYLFLLNSNIPELTSSLAKLTWRWTKKELADGKALFVSYLCPDHPSLKTLSTIGTLISPFSVCPDGADKSWCNGGTVDMNMSNYLLIIFLWKAYNSYSPINRTVSPQGFEDEQRQRWQMGKCSLFPTSVLMVWLPWCGQELM